MTEYRIKLEQARFNRLLILMGLLVIVSGFFNL